jgi:hypothetical protein
MKIRMEPYLRNIEFLAIGLGVTLGKLFMDIRLVDAI